MILVYAGRRVDPPADAGAPSAAARFPLGNVTRVAQDVAQVLRELLPSTVVGSAACGADLLVLESAAELGIRRRIILPFNRTKFRASSVTDRPGDWGARFDAIISDASARGDLVELALEADDDAAYLQANLAIFHDAEILARSGGENCRALVIWNRAARGGGDVTADFLNEARRREWSPTEIDTIG
jgi:hypothetical protein